MVKIHTVGGFSEVGKNMVVVELEEDAFIFDEGFFLPAIVSMEERDRVMTEKRLKTIFLAPGRQKDYPMVKFCLPIQIE